jgi:hypothetical protein
LCSHFAIEALGSEVQKSGGGMMLEAFRNLSVLDVILIVVVLLVAALAISCLV